MASGHMNRANRPNTWPHRPACKREEKPCQLGAVHTWHKADKSRLLLFVRFRGKADIDGTTLTESDLLRHALKQIRPSPSPPKARRQRRTTRSPRGHEPTAPSPWSCRSSSPPARRDGE